MSEPAPVAHPVTREDPAGPARGAGDHALEVLEFHHVLERVAARAVSPSGRRHLRALRPRTCPSEGRSELGRVGAVLHLVAERPAWALPRFPDVEDSLERLLVEGTVLEAPELRGLATLIEVARTMRKDLLGSAEAEPSGVLGELAESLPDLGALLADLDHAVDEEGQVRDRASKALGRVRGRLRGAHARVVALLERILAGVPERHVVADASVTMREGRYVIPVRREGRRALGGIVHDESQTGATLYVEPPAAVEATNEVRELEREEAREVRRVLAKLSARAAADLPTLRETFHGLTELDSLQARARTAASWRAAVPELLDGPADGLRLVGARHPLLLEADGATEVVPFDLDLDPTERAVVVSGPNTGGKSVFLKATGLVAALAQSGVVPPVGPGTRLPCFGALFADIGDEQSIERSLSTFSAHLENLSGIVRHADERALVLIDEMGTGTDPAEGAALAQAVLETLVGSGALAIVSSHLGALKRLDRPGSGIVNASLQFDAERMAPTYHLVKGRPGRSYGLSIARRLGFPAEVLDRADAYRDVDEARLEDTLARLERREAEVAALLDRLESDRRRSEALARDLDEREAELREAEREHREGVRREARTLLMEARAEVEDVVRELRESASGGADLDEAVHAARSRIEEAAARRRAPATSPRERAARAETVEPDVESGQTVRLRATGARGTVVEVRGQRAVVEAGAVRLEVDLAELEGVGDGGGQDRVRSASRPSTSPRGHTPAPDARIEVDLRGLRVAELELALARALDDAVREDLPELRIIHGKGTGALRARVREMLQEDPRVRSHRMGAPTEGGAGVTVAGFGSAS